MTEDETFRRLKRTTFEEVHARSLEIYQIKNPSYSLLIMLKKVLEDCNWTEDEYMAEYEARDIAGLYE